MLLCWYQDLPQIRMDIKSHNRCVQYRLQPVELIACNSGQQTVTVVNSRDDEPVDYCLPGVHRQGLNIAVYPA